MNIKCAQFALAHPALGNCMHNHTDARAYLEKCQQLRALLQQLRLPSRHSSPHLLQLPLLESQRGCHSKPLTL